MPRVAAASNIHRGDGISCLSVNAPRCGSNDC